MASIDSHPGAAPRQRRPTKAPPPPPPTTTTNAERIEQLRREDAALRRWHLQIRTWGLRVGLAIQSDGLTVVVATLLDAERELGIDPRWWTTTRVQEFAWSDCVVWCISRGVDIPKTAAAALGQFWAFLDEGPGFAPGSDALAALQRSLGAARGGAKRTRSTGKHPATGEQTGP